MRMNGLRYLLCLCLFGMVPSSTSSAAQQQQTTEEITAGLFEQDVVVVNTDIFVPFGEDPPTPTGFDLGEIPTSLNELSNIETLVSVHGLDGSDSLKSLAQCRW